MRFLTLVLILLLIQSCKTIEPVAPSESLKPIPAIGDVYSTIGIPIEISLKSQLGEGSEFLIQLPNLESESLDDDTFSSDGNDFLFDNDEDDMLF